MTEIHPDYGPAAQFSDHKRGDSITYWVDRRTERGEILWVAAASTLPNGHDSPPHYVVAPERGGLPDMVLFGNVVVNEVATTISEKQDKKPLTFAEIEEREHLYRNDVENRYFKRWLRKNRQPRYSDFARRILDDQRLPHHASRSRYEHCLRHYGYAAGDLDLFQEAWKDMLLGQS